MQKKLKGVCQGKRPDVVGYNYGMYMVVSMKAIYSTFLEIAPSLRQDSTRSTVTVVLGLEKGKYLDPADGISIVVGVARI